MKINSNVIVPIALASYLGLIMLSVLILIVVPWAASKSNPSFNTATNSPWSRELKPTNAPVAMVEANEPGVDSIKTDYKSQLKTLLDFQEQVAADMYDDGVCIGAAMMIRAIRRGESIDDFKIERLRTEFVPEAHVIYWVANSNNPIARFWITTNRVYQRK